MRRLSSKKNIVLAAFGTYGDLHPMMALGLALQQRGAQVTLASHPDYRAKVEAAGLTFCPCGPLRDAYLKRLNMPMEAIVERTARDAAFMFEQLVAPGIIPGVEDILPAIRQADLVVATSLAYAADIAAQLAGKPFIVVALQPMILMSAWDPPLLTEVPFILSPKSLLGRTWNRLMLAAGGLYLRRGLRPIAAAYRHFGVTSRFAVSGVASNRMTLALFSPLLAKAQPDWPPNTCILGTPVYDSEDGRASSLPTAVAAFLDTGPPPLVFSLGSAAVHAGETYYRNAIAATQSLGQRCIILCGPDSPLLGEDFGAEVCITAYAPHSLLFPRALAVIHHGGIGSTAQALRCGRPILTTPVFADQFDNARRVERLGCGLTLDFKRFTPDAAARALGQLLASATIAETCARVGPIIAAEDGAGRAAELLMAG